MRKTFIFISFLLSCITVFGQSGYKIEVHLKHFQSGSLYLGNYYGQNTFIVDTTEINKDGIAVFEGKNKLPGGIYFILYPNRKKYFEIVIDEDDHFSVDADSTQHFKTHTFHHSPINALFKKYNDFLNNQFQKIAEAQKMGKDSVTIAGINGQVQKHIQDYRNTIIKEHSQTLLATLFKAMQDPVAPPKPTASTDSSFAYHYFRTHYWDGVDFSDSSIVRTPILEMRLNRYFSQLVPMHPDSVNLAADKLLEKAEANKEVFKFTLWWLTSHYEKTKYMGMDAVFVHLVEKYYVTGKAFWVKKDQLNKIIDKASKIAPNLIGNTAPELTFLTTNNETIKLSAIRARYTILVFWDPTCGHCKIIVPQLDSMYESSWKEKGVEMVGILAGGPKEQWLEFIKTHHLKDWINVQIVGDDTFRQLYDVYMTPVIYLLDKDKKISAKQMSVSQLDNFIRWSAHKTEK